LECKHWGGKWRKTLARKPTFTLVEPPDATGVAPPRKLGKDALALWNAVMSEHEISDAASLEVLCLICEASARVVELGRQIARDGSVVRVRGVPKAHPALRDELQNRAFVVKGLEKLGINVEAVKAIGRPGKPTGRNRENADE
jgi:hypothetical protein